MLYTSGMISFRPRLWHPAIVVFAALPLLAFPAHAEVEGGLSAPPRAREGSIDLRAWDFDRGPVALIGSWYFARGRLYDPAEALTAGDFVPRHVPDRWQGAAGGVMKGEGAGTYRLDILLPPDSTGLALRYSTVSTAFTLFADGRVIGGAGRPSLDPRLAIPAYRPGILALPASPDGRLHLLVEVSNYAYRSGGLWRPIFIGRHSDLVNARFFDSAFAIGLAAALTAMSIHALLLFAHRSKERSYLYFAVFSLLVALRSLVTGEYVLVALFPGLPFDSLIRIEYLTAFLLIPFATLFFFSLFSTEISRKLLLLLVLPHVPFALLIAWAPLSLLTRSISYYYPVALILMCCTIVLILARAASRRRPGSGIPLAASAIVAVAAVNDMLFSSFIISTFNAIPAAMGIFVLMQDFVLARRYSQAFSDNERLSVELRQSNLRLSREIEGHREARWHLELLVAEKETHLQEIHHRIKNSLQIVSSIAGLQSHRIEDETAARALSSLRDRIRAISLVHEKLYESGSEDKLDVLTYARELLDRLSMGLGGQESSRIELECAPLRIPASYCIDLGLVLAELAANAFRHALPDGGIGRMKVKVAAIDGGLSLSVCDSGPGFPENFSIQTDSSVGFKIVTSIVMARGGRVEIIAGAGGCVEVRLPFRKSEIVAETHIHEVAGLR